MALFKNRIRLPFYLRQPQFPTELEQFRLANGTAKTIFAVVRKTYEGITDQMHESILQKMAIALVHDSVNIEGPKYAGDVVIEGEFQITWQDFLDYPLGAANFTVQVSPFFETNNNCQTCEEATQLNLEDDEFYGDLDEGESATINVFNNDVICCSPITASIVSFNAAYLDSMTIDETTGDVTVVVKNPAPVGDSIKIGTYRVTCPNGGFDDADIYATIAGTEPACQPITNLVVEDMDGDAGTATVTFDPSPSLPADDYDWTLYECDNLGLVGGVQRQRGMPYGPIMLTGLIPGKCYVIAVVAVCEEDVFISDTIATEFTMPGTESNCVFFSVVNADYPDHPLAQYTYMDCNGNMQNGLVRGVPDSVCMLSTDGVTPTFFTSNGPGLAQAIASGPCT